MSNRETEMTGDFHKRMQDFVGVVAEDGSIPDVQAFIQAVADSGLYWIVLTYGLDWSMVVKKIAADFTGDTEGEVDPLVFRMGIQADFPDYARFDMPDPPSVHLLQRALVPPEVLSVRFGVGLEKVEEAKYIRLSPTAAMRGKGLPAPSLGQDEISTALH